MTSSEVGASMGAEDHDVADVWRISRVLIGVLGLLLPFLLPAGAAVAHALGFQWAIPPSDPERFYPGSSISIYIYSPVWWLFAGVLFALGVILIGYDPYPDDPRDNWFSSAAGVASILVAAIPTPVGQPSWQVLHFVAAAVFFLCLATFCLGLFPRTGPPGNGAWSLVQDVWAAILGEHPKLPPPPEDLPWFETKAGRNVVYRWCGRIILVSLVLIAVLFPLKLPGCCFISLFYVVEAVPVLAFAVAWLVKARVPALASDA